MSDVRVGYRAVQLCSNDLCPTPDVPLTRRQLDENSVPLSFGGYGRVEERRYPFCDACFAEFKMDAEPEVAPPASGPTS